MLFGQIHAICGLTIFFGYMNYRQDGENTLIEVIAVILAGCLILMIKRRIEQPLFRHVYGCVVEGDDRSDSVIAGVHLR